MSAVLTDTFLGDIPIERIEYLAVIGSKTTTIHTAERTTQVNRSRTLVGDSALRSAYSEWGCVKIKKRDGVWCSVERPIGCLAITVVVSE